MDEFTKKYKAIKKIFGIYALICLIIYIIGFISAFSNNSYTSGYLFYYGGVTLAIPIGILVMIVIVIVNVILFKTMFNDMKKLNYVNIISSLIVMILFFIGIYILASGVSIKGLYEIKNIKVIDISDCKLIVSYNDSTDERYEIRKPFFIRNIKKNDYITVRYHVSNPEKMHYVISTDIGLIMLGISILVSHIIIALDLITLLIKSNRIKKKKVLINDY